MKQKENFIVHVRYNELEEIQGPISKEYDTFTGIYILTKDSFLNYPNFDIQNLLKNDYKFTKEEIIQLQNSDIKLNYTFDEIMSLKENSIDFFILDEIKIKELLIKISIQIDSLYVTDVFYIEQHSKNYIYFSSEDKYISIKKSSRSHIEIPHIHRKQNLYTNSLNLFPKENFYKHNKSNYNYQTNNNNANNDYQANNDYKSKIIHILILLYGNEKEIERYYSEGIWNLKKYYLINKDWINKFKEVYHYKEIIKIPQINKINTFNECVQKLKILKSINEVKIVSNKICSNISILSQINLSPNYKSSGDFNQYYFPVDFVIIHELIFNLLKELVNNIVDSEYEISFGKSMLCFRLNYDLNRMYFYKYSNESFKISGIIELFADVWKYIFDKYLSKITFYQYLTKKNINLNIINKNQILLSTGNKHLGYIYLMDKINNKDNFKNIYIRLLNSLNTLRNNQLNLTNIETIKNYLSSKKIIGLHVFIIETEKLKYCFDTINQLQGILNDFSFCLSDNDLITPSKILESTKYSFINEEICKYFKIHNTNDFSKVFLFVNKKSNNGRDIFIYFEHQDNLLKIINYKKNTFNIQKLINPKKGKRKNHTTGLTNIGSTSYINSILQCLAYTKSIKNYFLNNNIYNQDIITKPISLTKCFADVIRKLWNQPNDIPFPPYDFKNIIGQMNSLFQGFQPNDAKDLLIFLLEEIHNELNNPSQNPNEINLNNIPIELIKFRQDYYSQNYSIISKIFYYEHCNIIKCQHCGFKKYNYNVLYSIEFPLEKIREYLQKCNPYGFYEITLNDCFKFNERPEVLEGSNQIHCIGCKEDTNALIYNKIYTSPEILIIVLNRGIETEFGIQFSFPFEISLDKYIIDKTKGTNYELICVLNHHGSNGSGGHFVSYCKSPIDNIWYFHDDAKIVKCPNVFQTEQFSFGFPYILFYQRKAII